MVENVSYNQIYVVPIDRLRLHERYVPRRVKKLKASIKDDGILKDPILAVKHQNTFTVLDGATRTQALTEIGIQNIVVQLVDYEGANIELKCWNHLLKGFDSKSLLTSIQSITGEKGASCRVDELEASLLSRESSVGFVNQHDYALSFQGPDDLKALVLFLNQIVEIYSHKTDVHRIAGSSVNELRKRYEDLSAIVLFPTFLPAEVLQCASSSYKIPAGITRHVNKIRISDLNIPLQWLDHGKINPSQPEWLSGLICDLEERRQLRSNSIVTHPQNYSS